MGSDSKICPSALVACEESDLKENPHKAFISTRKSSVFWRFVRDCHIERLKMSLRLAI